MMADTTGANGGVQMDGPGEKTPNPFARFTGKKGKAGGGAGILIAGSSSNRINRSFIFAGTNQRPFAGGPIGACRRNWNGKWPQQEFRTTRAWLPASVASP